MNMFWTGVLLAMVVSAFAPGWVKGIIFVVALMLSGVLVRLQAHAPHHLHAMVSPWLIAAGGSASGSSRGITRGHGGWRSLARPNSALAGATSAE
jgi:hypothetical protein